MKTRLLAVFMAAAALAASALTLDGKCPIVIPTNANVQERYAAEELAKYLGEVLDAQMKIIPEETLSGGLAIFLGDTNKAQAENFGQFANEEYAIKAKNDSVIIAGTRFRGILYAAYDFVERFAGVRFFTPDCEVVPKHKSIEIPDDFALRRKPAFEFRQIYAGSGHKGWPEEFRPKQRCNVGTNKPELGGSDAHGTGGGCHTYYMYSKDFPKEISWMNASGERTIVTTPYNGSICFSQPEAVKRFTARLKDLIAGDRKSFAERGLPAPRFYAVQQNDCDATCYCPECLAFKEKHGLSGLVIDFTNKIADAIKDEYPDVYILIFAYFDTLEPPLTDIRPRSNVLPQITTYLKKYHDHQRAIDDPVNAQASELFDRWAAISDNLAMWDYWRYFTGFLPPSTPVKNIAGLMRKYRQDKVRFFFVEYELGCRELLSFFDLTSYVGYKLIDNPDLDTDALIDEFMTAYYGPAAPYMRKYLDLVTEKFKMCGNVVEELTEFSQKKYVNDMDFYVQGLELLGEADDVLGSSGRYRDNKERVHAETLIFLATYLKGYLKNNADKPIMMKERPMTAERVKKIIDYLIPEAANALLADSEKSKKRINSMYNFYKGENNVKPEQIIPPKALNELPDAGFTVYDVDSLSSSAAKINDEDAPKGVAYSIAEKWDKEKNEKNHQGPFTFGLYEQSDAYYPAITTFTENDIPQDEKYHWYYVGKSPLYPSLVGYIHWTWELGIMFGPFYDAKNAEQAYDIYFLLKLQGPAYVKGSTKTNDVRLAGMAMKKVNN